MLNPYSAERLGEEHRNDLLRRAEAWRLAHPVQVETTKRIRVSMVLHPWLRRPIRLAGLRAPLDRSLKESKTALEPCSCCSQR